MTVDHIIMVFLGAFVALTTYTADNKWEKRAHPETKFEGAVCWERVCDGAFLGLSGALLSIGVAAVLS